ncbi:MAG: ECF transporter S component, partial [Eubacteriales bacterium]|nr:ECF transporter S component [Eubacteriales bacterium]
FAGVLFSGLMDVWTVMWMDGRFNLSRYIAAVASSASFTLIYAVSNVIFLLVCARPIGKILTRIRTKYGI